MDLGLGVLVGALRLVLDRNGKEVGNCSADWALPDQHVSVPGHRGLSDGLGGNHAGKSYCGDALDRATKREEGRKRGRGARHGRGGKHAVGERDEG